jgi:hypothetical protein
MRESALRNHDIISGSKHFGECLLRGEWLIRELQIYLTDFRNRVFVGENRK